MTFPPIEMARMMPVSAILSDVCIVQLVIDCI